VGDWQAVEEAFGAPDSFDKRKKILPIVRIGWRNNGYLGRVNREIGSSPTDYLRLFFTGSNGAGKSGPKNWDEMTPLFPCGVAGKSIKNVVCSNIEYLH